MVVFDKRQRHSSSPKNALLVYASARRDLGLVHTGKQLFCPIFVPISGTDKQAVHTGTERLNTSFALHSDGNAIVPLTCFPFACSDGSGTER